MTNANYKDAKAHYEKKMAETKTMDGLSLMDYKEIEREAISSLVSGHKIVLASELMLDNAVKCIRSLGGMTAEDEDEAARVERLANKILKTEDDGEIIV